ncbi:MAG: MATE family efflux transporter [Spirochaetia bacterium]|jgi:putative MATE family efflux protein|nr:MATE family efflux transporter [Spirochaetia bacterium]
MKKVWKAEDPEIKIASEEKLTEGKIPRLLLKISIPASTGLLFNTLYNLTDTFFGARISTEALAGLSISFPVFFIILALALGLGTASVALISNSLGAGENKKGVIYFVQAISFSIILAFILFFLRGFYIETVFSIMGATGEVLEYAALYIKTILLGIPFFLLNNVLNSMLNARGNTKSYRNVLAAGFVVNLFLDPLLLYGWSFIPAMGIKGLALATVLVQAGAFFYLLSEVVKTGVFCRYFTSTAGYPPRFSDADGDRDCKKINREVFKYFIPKISYIKEILAQSIPSVLNMMSVALGFFVVNYFLNKYGGRKALAAYAIGLRIEQIALLPALGLNTALLAVIGQNCGAGKIERVKRAFKTALVFGALLMAVMLSLILPPSGFIISLFTKDSGVVFYADYYLRIVGITYYSYIILFCCNSMLQGIKKPGFVLAAGFFRQIAAPAALFYYICGVKGFGAEGIFSGIAAISWTTAAGMLVFSLRKLSLLKK